MHRTTSRFRKCFKNLPESVQIISKKNFELLKANPLHPSLHFKKLGKIWSIRAGINYSVGYAHNPIQEKQEIYYDLLLNYS